MTYARLWGSALGWYMIEASAQARVWETRVSSHGEVKRECKSSCVDGWQGGVIPELLKSFVLMMTLYVLSASLSISLAAY